MKKRFFSLILALALLFSMIPFAGMAYPAAYPLPKLTGNQAMDVVNIARSQIGYTKNNGTVYGAWWTGVTNWGVDYTYSDWCAMFACWCANQAGAGLGVAYNKEGASCTKLFKWYRNNATYDVSFSTEPQPGDFIFFGVNLDKVQHVAIVTSYDSSTGLVNFTGGNQRVEGGMVSSEICYWYSGAKNGAQYVLGYGRPNYTSAAPKIPGKPVLTSPNGGTYKEGQFTPFRWNDTVNTTHYNLYVDRKNASGQWEEYRYMIGVNKNSDHFFDVGEYRAYLRACNTAYQGADGKELYTQSDIVYFQVVPAACNHSYTVQVIKAPTCTAKGVKTFTCTACGHSYTEAIPARGHTYHKGICVSCGTKDPNANFATITQQPKSVKNGVGKTVKLTVKATGDGLKYNWYVAKKGAKKFTKSSVTKNVYTVKLSDSWNGAQVRCVVTDKYGNQVKSNAATLTVVSAPKITQQPKNVAANTGARVSLVVKASGEGLRYQWYFANKGAEKWTKSSLTSNVYSVKISSAVNGRKVRCVVTDRYGNTVTSSTATIYKGTPVRIKTQPKSITVQNGKTAKITIKATGSGLKYSWYYMRAGATKYTKASSTKNIFSVKMARKWDGAKVYCKVTDKYGITVKSSVVTLSVFRPQEAAAGAWRSEKQILTSGKSIKNTTMTVKITAAGAVTIKTTKDGTGYNKGTFNYDLIYERMSGDRVYYRLVNFWGEHTATYSVSKNQLTIKLSNGNKFILNPQ